MATQKIRLEISLFFKDLFVIASLSIVGLLLITGVIAAVFFFKKLPPQIPLFYSLPWGEEQLASPLQVVFIALAGLGVYALNVVLSLFLYTSSKYLSHMLIVGATLVPLFTTVTLFQIIRLVI